MTLGEYLKGYREMHGLSQRKLAQLTGLSNTYISNLEKGLNGNGSVTSPSFETYQLIAKATGCTASDLIALLDDNEQKEKPAPEGELPVDFYNRLAMLTPDELKTVDAFVQGILATR